MKGIRPYYFLLIILFSCIIEARIISSLKEVINFIKPGKKTVALFDIDNTLLHPTTDLGSDQWFSHMVQQRVNAGVEKIHAVKEALPLYFHVNHHIDLTPTELGAEVIVDAIKKACTHTLCLTARSLELIEKTVHALNYNKFNFHLTEIDTQQVQLPGKSVYKSGVLFCGGHDKGQVLLAFLKSIGHIPDIIVFVDDKQQNLDSLERAINQINASLGSQIVFIGLRYTGCDDRVAAFDSQKTEQELQEFLLKHPFYPI